MLDNSIFNKASDSAMLSALLKTVKERESAIGVAVFSEIINKLKESSVSENEILAIEKEINFATDKNIAIANVLNKGGNVAIAIIDIIKNF